MGKIISKIADYLRECDKILMLLCIAASSYGCIAVLSATRCTGSLRQFLMHVIAMVVGVSAVVVISNFDYRNFSRFWPVVALLTLVPVILTFFIGYAPGETDDKAWLYIFGVSFQPSELLKIGFAITFGLHLSHVGAEINKFTNVILLCIHGAIPVMLIHIQGDDGTALVFLIMFISMMFAAGLKLRYWVTALILVVAAIPVIYFVIMNDDQRSRILSMFDIEGDLLGAGWQQWRGRIALANGGIFGCGLFKGPLTQVKDAIPEGYNDFIFTCIGEELGLLGCLAVVILLLAICIKVLLVGKSTGDKFGFYICVGVFGMLAAQTVINLGMCLSILPVIGVTLPFFSAGGTSLLCLYLGIGVVMSVHMHRTTLTPRLHDNNW